MKISLLQYMVRFTWKTSDWTIQYHGLKGNNWLTIISDYIYIIINNNSVFYILSVLFIKCVSCKIFVSAQNPGPPHNSKRQANRGTHFKDGTQLDKEPVPQKLRDLQKDTPPQGEPSTWVSFPQVSFFLPPSPTLTSRVSAFGGNPADPRRAFSFLF